MAKFVSQFILTVLCNFTSFFFGLHISWLAPFEEELRNGSTILQPGLSSDQVSWLASLPTLTILLSAPIIGCLLKHAGRRKAALISSLPNVLTFAILMFTSNIYLAYIARIFGGFVCAGALIITPLYVNECVEERRRGFLGGQSPFYVNIGVALSFLFGRFGTYELFNRFCFGASVVSLLSFLWLPESPIYLAGRNQNDEAKKSLVKLGRSDAAADNEMQAIAAALSASQAVKTLGVSGVILDRGLRKALIICLVVLSTQQLSGVSAICSYMLHILEDANNNIDNRMITVIIGLLQILASILAPVMLLAFGRKTNLLISGFAMTAALAVLSLSLCINVDFSYISAMAMANYVFFYLLGFGSVPYVLMPEIVAPDGREIVVAIVGVTVASLSFAVTKCFYSAVNLIGLFGVFSLFTVFSLVGTIFVCFFVFETRGKTTVEICEVLKGNKSCK